MTRLRLILLLSLWGVQESQAQGPLHFRMQRVSTETYESVGAFDVNGDGQPDLVSGGFWYEGPAFTRRHAVGEIARYGEYYDDFSTIPLDVNGDGRLDFVTGGWWGNTIRWRENPGKAETEWPEHIIAETGNVETSRAWDVDGDGSLELVPNTPGHPLRFYRLGKDGAGKVTGKFTTHTVHNAKQGHGLGFGDVNNDGRGDFVLSDGWLEAPPNPLTGQWTWHSDFSLSQASVPILVADVNNDGLSDLLVGQAHGYGLDWYEQLRASGQKAHSWKRHVIDPYNAQFHEMAWVDLDGDGKPELVTGKRYRAHNDKDPGSHDDYGLYYYQWNGESFTKQVICYGSLGVGKGTGIHFAITDLNADGRPDLAVAGKDGLCVFFNERIIK